MYKEHATYGCWPCFNYDLQNFAEWLTSRLTWISLTHEALFLCALVIIPSGIPHFYTVFSTAANKKSTFNIHLCSMMEIGEVAFQVLSTVSHHKDSDIGNRTVFCWRASSVNIGPEIIRILFKLDTIVITKRWYN